MEKPQLELDRALARRVASGDESAFNQFFREYFPRLFRFTMARTGGDEVLAEEIVQRTMCKVVRKIGSYRGEALLFSWLCRICRNETAEMYRKSHVAGGDAVPIEDNPSVRAALESIADDLATPEAEQLNDELARFVHITLEHLPARYSTALEMKYISGCSVEEIGERLEISSKAAESVLSRARAAFKEGFRSLWDFESGFLLE